MLRVEFSARLQASPWTGQRSGACSTALSQRVELRFEWHRIKYRGRTCLPGTLQKSGYHAIKKGRPQPPPFPLPAGCYAAGCPMDFFRAAMFAKWYWKKYTEKKKVSTAPVVSIRLMPIGSTVV